LSSKKSLLFYNFDQYPSVFDFAAVTRQLHSGDFLVLPVSHVEFPAVTGTHNRVARKNAALEAATRMRANVGNTKNFAANPYQQDRFTFEPNRLHLAFPELAVLYRTNKTIAQTKHLKN
jgi:hypothetical protein